MTIYVIQLVFERTSVLLLDFHENLVVFHAEVRPLFHADALHILGYADCMNAVNQYDAVARAQGDFFEQCAVVGVEFYHNLAALHHEHLLQVGYFPPEGLW